MKGRRNVIRVGYQRCPVELIKLHLNHLCTGDTEYEWVNRAYGMPSTPKGARHSKVRRLTTNALLIIIDTVVCALASGIALEFGTSVRFIFKRQIAVVMGLGTPTTSLKGLAVNIVQTFLIEWT